ncbi:hypothetical protein Bcsk_007530 [Bartonella sp. CDC_skunk]|uniref:hypothetical protein n=1 Tax=unclassified Bartonella TaxID=2645622 RepID=UPI00099ADE44|nr:MULTISPECIES: hypothetical protein [unclassified Bartonella]AQX21395.1 hypothetical protein Bcsk_007530 [Bartonella sp. CDC_skunk]AQX26656.1 hypothetical protein Bra60_006510 [Bartonella sp. Raccoon60]
MVEKISYAFTKDKSKWKELIEKREKLRKRITIKKKNQFAKHNRIVFFRATAGTFIIICLILVVFVCLPDSFSPYLLALIILMPALPLTVCIAPIQRRIQVLPLSLLIQIMLFWFQFYGNYTDKKTVIYIVFFEIFMYTLFSFFHIRFTASKIRRAIRNKLELLDLL